MIDPGKILQHSEVVSALESLRQALLHAAMEQGYTGPIAAIVYDEDNMNGVVCKEWANLLNSNLKMMDRQVEAIEAMLSRTGESSR